MLSSFRTLGSITRSRTSRNPDLVSYTVKPVTARRQLWAVRVLGTVCVTFFLAPRLVSAYNAFTLPEKPVYIPVGMIEKVDPVPFKRGCREENAHARFMKDEKTRDKAELLILERAVAIVQERVRINIGKPAGYGPSYWMLWKLPKPPPTYRRKYLQISNDGFEFVTRPVSPYTVTKIDSILYPKAVLVALYTYIHTLYSPVSAGGSSAFAQSPTRAINITHARLNNTRNGASGNTGNEKDTIDNEETMFTPMEMRRALGMGLATLQKEWAKSRREPPPPRGWPVADTRFMLNGPNLSVTIDCLATINPQKVEAGQVKIISMEIKHIQPNHTGQVLLGKSRKE